LTLQPAVYICSKCDQGLPVWQQAILAFVGVAIAFAILYGLSRLITLRSDRRDRHLRQCFLAIQRVWGAPDAAQRVSRFVTPELLEKLRVQLDGALSRGQTIHHEDAAIERLTVLSGGGKHDQECVARIQSSVRSWVTDAGGELVSGSKERSQDNARWRFVRDPAGAWLAAEIRFQ
jgi:predicted lipid-binding transport protein (Tim44 family)